MDKRTFIFVLSLTFILFGVNVFFQQRDQAAKQEWLARQELKKAQAPVAADANRSTKQAPFVAKTPEASLAKIENVAEKFYVIENDYQQLVFSNVGAALVEINLPFKTEQNQRSVVKETQVDRDLIANHPKNSQFPLRPYFTAGTTTKDLVAHETGKLGGYYPLLRRGIVDRDNKTIKGISPEYYAANIVSKVPEDASLVFELKEFTANSISFEASQDHRRILKTYSVESEKDAPYVIRLSIKVDGDSSGLWIISGVPEVEWISGAIAPSLKYRITINNKPEVVLLGLPESKQPSVFNLIYPDWLTNSNGFFGVILDPVTAIDSGLSAQYVPGKNVPSRLTKVDEAYNKFKAEDMPGYMMQLPLNSKGETMDFRLFTGPFASGILKTVDSVYSDAATSYNPDYIASQTFHGLFAFISEPFAKFLFVLMSFFHYLTGSWGISIILLTVALRFMLYPLNAWSTKSMLKMQKISPQVTAIQEKNKKDPKKTQIEIMDLYKKEGVNPVSSCFPLLIQMPFMVGMFDLLKSTFELRGASFIPGWINDLSAPDVLFSWDKPLFFIGNQFHLLPILLGLVMFFQQKMSSAAPKDVSLMTEQQKQQRMMGYIMAAVFTIMFYNFPSGLNIYWLSSMLLGILQQWWTSKRMANTTQLALKTK